MKEMLRKLSSRKLWLALAGVATGVSMALGIDSSDVQAVAGAVTTLTSVLAYIITEGRVDATRVAFAVESAQEAAEVVDAQD
jgi:phage shock protein PspC (stress-responsive transcriptional regulator)